MSKAATRHVTESTSLLPAIKWFISRLSRRLVSTLGASKLQNVVVTTDGPYRACCALIQRGSYKIGEAGFYDARAGKSMLRFLDLREATRVVAVAHPR